jgi:hypothetical protein
MSEKFVKLPVSLIGKVSERAVILYSLMLDLNELSKSNKEYQDADGTPFVIFTVERVQSTFRIGQAQARATLKELEYAGMIIRKKQGQGRPAKTYIVQTAEKSAVKTAEKSAVKTAEKSAAIYTNKNYTNISSSSGQICENQTTFDEFFLEMTTRDAVSKIVAEVVNENSDEFAEITAKIADFVAENVRNAMKNQKVRNIRAYVRACLAHAKSDYDAACDASGTSRTETGYGATYDISLYENYSAADNPEWDD